MTSRTQVILALVLVGTLVVAGCAGPTGTNSTGTKPKPTGKTAVTASQKSATQSEYDITSVLADTIEAFDAALSSHNFANGTGGTVTVDGHGTTSVTLNWTGGGISGTGTVTVASSGTTVSTYALSYSGSTGSWVVHVTGTTSSGLDLDLTLTMTNDGHTTSTTVSGKVTANGSTYTVAGTSTTSLADKIGNWAYTITDQVSGVKAVISASYANGVFSGTMVITAPGPRGTTKTIATVTTTGDGTVTVTYADGTTQTIQVFPNPTK